MKRYFFTVGLTGTGNTEAEAWANAVNEFAIEPGEPTDVEVQEEED
jgi:hypothetical protein